MTHAETAGGILTVDLDALLANWRLLRDRLADGAACAAVVKADAYGIGAAEAAPVLARAGCEHFFVATIDEGIALKEVLDHWRLDAEVHVFNGLPPGSAADMARERLTPVLNSLAEVADWSAFCRLRDIRMPADLHVDTGMNRLGLPADELRRLADEPSQLDGIELHHVISHLATAEETDNPSNAAQLAAFRGALAALPAAKASLANSSGVFLGADYHFDLARPGAALYGVNPTPDAPNPMRQVVRLQGKILQVRSIDTPQAVGYGATHAVSGPARIATLAVGYADGYLRSGGNKASGYIGDVRTPVVGRISMDLTTVDVTGVPEDSAQPGMLVDLIGPHNPVDNLAAAGGTIGYEILTDLGRRYHRVYEGGIDIGEDAP